MLFLFFLFTVALGVIVDEKISISSKSTSLVKLDSFYFKAGGTFSYSLTARRDDLSAATPNTMFLLCTDGEFGDIVDRGKTDSVCLNLSNNQVYCSYIFRYPNATQSVIEIPERKVKKTARHWLILSNCGSEDFSGRHRYVLKNPGGEHLDTRKYPIPVLFMVFTGLWPIIAVLWFANARKHKERASPLLTWGVGMMPILYTLLMVTELIRWVYCSRTGYCHKYLARTLVAAAISVLYHMLLFLVIVCLSKGLFTTRLKIEGIEAKIIAAFALVVGGTVFAYEYYEGGYAVPAVLMIFICVVWFTFMSITLNTRAVKAQLNLLRFAGFDPPMTPAYSKLNMLIHFQRVIFVYVSIKSITFFLSTFLLEDFPWVSLMFEETEEFLFVTFILWIFRVRKRFVFPDQSEETHLTLPDPPHLSTGEGSRERERERSSLSWEDLLPPVPAAGPVIGNALQGSAEVVVVQSPVTLDPSGKKYVPCISVGQYVKRGAPLFSVCEALPEGASVRHTLLQAPQTAPTQPSQTAPPLPQLATPQ